MVCKVFAVSKAGYHYQAKQSSENTEIADRLVKRVKQLELGFMPELLA